MTCFSQNFILQVPLLQSYDADLAIGSVQSMAVVVNVMCIFKDEGGVDKLLYKEPLH